jgi:hypothetical protein
MAGDWIKIEKNLPTKPEVMEMAQILGVDELTVTGHLILFWSWCDSNMSRECPAVSGTKTGLDRASGRTGFVDAMIQVGWLVAEEESGRTVFNVPKFDRHLSKSAKTRANDTERRTRNRQTSAAERDKCPDGSGTKAGPEKRREEKSINDIQAAPGHGTDVHIPASLSERAVAAIGTWLKHTRHDESLRPVPENSPQEEALFRQVVAWDLSDDELELTVDTCIARGWLNLQRLSAKDLSGTPRRRTGDDLRASEALQWILQPMLQKGTGAFDEAVEKFGKPVADFLRDNFNNIRASNERDQRTWTSRIQAVMGS